MNYNDVNFGKVFINYIRIKNKVLQTKVQSNITAYKEILQEKDNRLFCKYGKKDRSIIWDEETLSHAMHCRCYLEKMLEPIQVEVNYDKADLMKQLHFVCFKF